MSTPMYPVDGANNPPLLKSVEEKVQLRQITRELKASRLTGYLGNPNSL